MTKGKISTKIKSFELPGLPMINIDCPSKRDSKRYDNNFLRWWSHVKDGPIKNNVYTPTLCHNLANGSIT